MNQLQIEAFWSKVDVKGNSVDCWDWQGAKKPAGYGNVRVNKKYLIAHRVAFSIVNGPIPDGYLVCHLCDNPSCCNPGHMVLGTSQSNGIDMVMKQRHATVKYSSRGSNNVNAKLDKEKVIEIRKLYSSGNKNQYELAEMYGVSQPNIGSVVRRETWRDV